MRRPDPGVSQSPALRHGLDYALLVGYNCMSLLWRKRTPIPARRPGVVRYAGSFVVSPSGAFTPPRRHAFCVMHEHTNLIKHTT